MKSIENIFFERINNDKLNTSYPLHPFDWAKYRISGEHKFLEDEKLSFYIHIPFCQNLCNFCEYTRMKCPDEHIQRQYLETLNYDIQFFIDRHPKIVLQGFDIGGGTPTSISEGNFTYLMDIYEKALCRVKTISDFEPSIEGTFNTLSKSKLQAINKVGIKRLSLGIQSTNKQILKANKRIVESMDLMRKWIEYAKSIGIQKINLDLMYGLEAQTLSDIEKDISMIVEQKPEQITLYELRTNMLNIKSKQSHEDLYNSYCTFFDAFTSMKYYSRFGQNTFSMNREDFGVSSYLRNRMLDGGAYKGFGIAAQSMNGNGISYNVGKNQKCLSSLLSMNSYRETDVFFLPKKELLSKYIAISAYSGRFSLKTASAILNDNCYNYYKNEIAFCLDRDLMELDGDHLHITRKGFENYGAVFSLFFLK